MARPEVPIDWEKVGNLLMAGCNGAQVAGYFGITAGTIYERCVKDNGITFTEFSLPFYSKGESILIAHQYAKALGKTHEGDNTLLIWLGKTRLNQIEKQNQQQIQQTITLKVDDGLRSGINIQTTSISNTDNNKSE